ncbi:ABC transporter ATP-binding protein [Lachnospiraceae bacterium NSJ-143]|nr:ABC transporter ATP-binding protein [Lachnospiraceae bacterium NSJ-143]
MPALLEISDFSLSFDTPYGEIDAVRNVNLKLNRGEILSLAGESGCGKTVLCKSVMKLLPKNTRVKSGKIVFNGTDITGCTEKQMRSIRGSKIAMVFQDPMTSLNPTVPVGRQIAEVCLRHEKLSRKEAENRAVRLMAEAGIENAEERFAQQPHFFSGGQRQRCVIAIALAANPEIILADEPTTALDVTVQAKILDLFVDIKNKTGVSIIFVSHDLGVAARIADRVSIMYAGKIVETGTAEEIFYDARHPYTWGLLSAMPYFAQRGNDLMSIPGYPPVLINIPECDAFAPRNPNALKIDFEQEPPEFYVSPTHSAATWLLDKRAPNVLPPDFIQRRRNEQWKKM